MNKVCLLIPVYNHGSLITATLERLKPMGLPCLLVDDGSDSATAQILQKLADEEAWLTLFRHQPNQGKGAAVLRGISEARRLGFSHALQVDADGQHTLEDIPKMLAMSEAEPNALISGVPVYDADVPASRLYGRYITHFWVWVETLSLSIKDSMCGFRVYPVMVTDNLARAHTLARRMDFDIDVMVRLFWRGVPVRFLSTKVNYPADGISHFALWEDNLRISRMHTRLVFGMIARSPLLLWRKLFPYNAKNSAKNERPSTHWSEVKESGAYLGMAFSIACYRLLGRKALYGLLYPIMAYFFLFNKQARSASEDFLQRFYLSQTGRDKACFSRPPRSYDSFQHFMNFGRSIVDRLASWTGDIHREEVIFNERALLLECIKEGRGGVILSSHLGNADMCRALVDSASGIKMNVLVFSDNAAQFNRLMKRVNPRSELELIQISSVGPGTAMLLNDKINNGEFIIIAADRTSASNRGKTVKAQFLGQPACFPPGAFILAGLMECPVFLLFCLKHEQYTIYLESFSENMKMPRRQRAELLQQYVGRYAQRLEHYVRMAPLQWYNFFDFWADTDEPTSQGYGKQQQMNSNKQSENL